MFGEFQKYCKKLYIKKYLYIYVFSFPSSFFWYQIYWRTCSSVILLCYRFLASLGCLAGTKLPSIQINFCQAATILALIAQSGSTSTLSRPCHSPGGLAMLCWVYNTYVLKFRIMRRKFKQSCKMSFSLHKLNFRQSYFTS